MRSSAHIPWRLLAAGIGLALAVTAAAMLTRTYAAHLRIEAVEAQALSEHAGEPVESLIAYLASDRHTLEDKNRAIWRLGQLGDARAIPILEDLRTGEPCDHARFVCQRELEKALAKLRTAR